MAKILKDTLIIEYLDTLYIETESIINHQKNDIPLFFNLKYRDLSYWFRLGRYLGGNISYYWMWGKRTPALFI